jgi:hypothetical protein
MISLFYYAVSPIANKAKGQHSPVLKLEPLALALIFRGRLAECSNATDCKSVNGASPTVQGSESLTGRQIASSVMALTTTGEMKRTAEAARIRKFSIRLLAVELNRRFHNDLSLLPDRLPINGVSGGPVIYSTSTDGIQIVGTISAYMPNRASGVTLPGLSIAQDVSHFNKIADWVWVKDRDQAQTEKKALAQEGSSPPTLHADPPNRKAITCPLPINQLLAHYRTMLLHPSC